MLDLAWQQGWTLTAKIDENRAAQIPFELTWRTSEPSVRVHLIRDFVTGLSYVVVDGPSRRDVVDLIRQTIPMVTLEDVLAEIEDPSRNESPRDAYRLGIVAPLNVADVRVTGGFRRLFTSPDPDVRKAAVWASSYTKWRDLRREIEALAQDDPDQEVRLDARTMLAAFDAQDRAEQGSGGHR
jgi:hypothetical protein